MARRRRWGRTALVVVLALVAAAAYVVHRVSDDDVWVDPPKPSPGATPATPPTTSPVPVPATAKRLGMTQPAWYADEYDLPAALAAFDQIRDAGVRWVVLTPTWYQADRTRALPRYDKEKTVSDAGVRRAAAKAKAAGLSVVLKPHVDLDDDGDRAEIVPRDLDRWFSAYEGLTVHYATLAREVGADELVVGTELVGTSTETDRWKRVIAQARSEFAGRLTYAANYDEYRQVRFWTDLDAIGIDAYFPLASRATTDVDELVAAWSPIATDLEALSNEVGRPVLFTEAGYPSQQGAVTAPYDWERSKTPAPEEQAAAYRALLTALWDRPWFAGVYWWMWDDLPGRTEDPQALDYPPHGKPAEAVLREWAARGP
jgi:hypothetical protein